MAWCEVAMGWLNPVRLSLLYAIAEKYTTLVLALVSAMIVSRLLTPAEIGTYSIGAVLAGLAQVVRDFGVGQYVIQAQELSQQRLRAALCTSMLVAAALALIVAAASGVVARFYHQAILQTVLQLLALNFVLIPFSALTLPYLRRQLRFAAIFAINVSHGVAQLVCAVALAWLGFGCLSLAWAALAGSVTALLVSIVLRPPGLPWLPCWRGMGEVLRFGTLSTAGGVVDELGVAAPDLIIGRWIGVAGVGVFGKAVGVLNIFNQLITSAISPVLFPLYAAQARQGGDARQAYLKTVSYMAALAWPFFVYVALMAPGLLRLLYGPQWDAAAPLIRVMCLSSAAYSMFSMARYLFVATGHVKAQAQLDVLAVPVRVAALLLAAPLGLVAVAWAVVFGALFRCGLTYFYLQKLAGIGWRDLIRATRSSLLVASLCGIGMAALQSSGVLQHAQLALAMLITGLGMTVLWLSAMLLCRHELVSELRLAN